MTAPDQRPTLAETLASLVADGDLAPDNALCILGGVGYTADEAALTRAVEAMRNRDRVLADNSCVPADYAPGLGCHQAAELYVDAQDQELQEAIAILAVDTLPGAQ